MLIRNSNIAVFVFAFLLIISNLVYSQEKRRLPTEIPTNIPEDSLRTLLYEKLGADSVNVPRQEEVQVRSSSGLDSTVTYSANDTIVLNLKTRTVRMRGDAKLNFKNQYLESEVIIMSFDESNLYSEGVKDSLGRIKGFPKFNDKGQEFVGERIIFNFKTSQGTITLGETEMGDGYYYGSKIKKIDATSLFVSDGRYTTCDPPYSYYYFGSPKMKVIFGDRVFLDPLYLYVEDMPVLFLPFGLFFPNKSGRQSGVIIPSFYFSASRGVVFQDFGFYWAASDYWDTQVTTDIFTKGGFMLKNRTRYILRDRFTGNLNVEYGRTRLNPDDSWNKNWRMQFSHSQQMAPGENLNANLNFSSANFNRQTSFNTLELIEQNISSRAEYSKSFDNRSTLSVSYDRNQNIINDSYTQNIPLRYSLPSYTPLRGFTNLPRWTRDTRIGYSVNANYNDSKSIQYQQVRDENSEDPNAFRTDTSLVYRDSRRIEHRPSLSFNPKLGYFSLNPSISFSANNYFRKLTRNFNPEDSTLIDSYEGGFFTEYRYSASIGASTKLYGIADDRRPFLWFVKASWFGVNAIRHTINPSVGWSFSPDQSDADLGFYGYYYDERSQREVRYSRYERDGGGLASSMMQQSLNFSDNQTLEMKIKQKDTLPDKNLELLRLNYSFNYNFAADSLNFSDISVGFRTPAITFMEFSGNANFTLYDEDIIVTENPNTGFVSTRYQRVNRYLHESGKGFMRMNRISFRISTRYSSRGQSFSPTFSQPTDIDTSEQEPDAIQLGERFRRGEEQLMFGDIMGEDTPGYTPFSIPWSINLGLNYSYSKPSQDPNSKREEIYLNFNLNFSLTDTWSITSNGGYDFISKELRAPNINISKVLDCDWLLSLNWNPMGFNRGFYLKFGLNVPQLQDLKLEKRSNRLLR
jgi:hypothetical protein